MTQTKGLNFFLIKYINNKYILYIYNVAMATSPYHNHVTSMRYKMKPFLQDM